jgi:hypothetical protein
LFDIESNYPFDLCVLPQAQLRQSLEDIDRLETGVVDLLGKRARTVRSACMLCACQFLFRILFSIVFSAFGALGEGVSGC